MTKTELNTTIKDIRQLEAMLKEVETEIKSKKAQVTTFMNDNEITSYVGDDYKITINEVERKTLDKASLVADLGSLEDYEKVSTYKRLLIK